MTKILGIVNITPDSFWSGSRGWDYEVELVDETALPYELDIRGETDRVRLKESLDILQKQRCNGTP